MIDDIKNCKRKMSLLCFPSLGINFWTTLDVFKVVVRERATSETMAGALNGLSQLLTFPLMLIVNIPVLFCLRYAVSLRSRQDVSCEDRNFATAMIFISIAALAMPIEMLFLH